MDRLQGDTGNSIAGWYFTQTLGEEEEAEEEEEEEEDEEDDEEEEEEERLDYVAAFADSGKLLHGFGKCRNLLPTIFPEWVHTPYWSAKANQSISVMPYTVYLENQDALLHALALPRHTPTFAALPHPPPHPATISQQALLVYSSFARMHNILV